MWDLGKVFLIRVNWRSMSHMTEYHFKLLLTLAELNQANDRTPNQGTANLLPSYLIFIVSLFSKRPNISNYMEFIASFKILLSPHHNIPQRSNSSVTSIFCYHSNY